MSNGYATIESFAAHSNKRRFQDDVELPAVGKVSLGSMTAGDFCRFDAARSRATMLGISGEHKKQAQALQEVFIILATTCVLSRDHNPLFDETHRPLLLGLDASIAEAITAACVQHCRLDEADVGDAQKN